MNMDDFEETIMKFERTHGYPLVMVKHKPTGIVRLCDNTQSELLNSSLCIQAIARCLENDPDGRRRRSRQLFTPQQRQFW